MRDKTKKKTIIVLTKEAYMFYHNFPFPLLYLFYSFSDINIIIAYTKARNRAKENRRSSTPWPIKSTC